MHLCGWHFNKRYQEDLERTSKILFKKLYKSNPEIKFHLTNDTGIGITNEQRDMFERPITKEEMTTSIKQLTSNKTPRPDSLSEFFHFFLD